MMPPNATAGSCWTGLVEYYMPNDGTENNRLDLQHNLFLLTSDNKLGLSSPNLPGFKAGRALDLGTGTGIWAIDFADEHPETGLRRSISSIRAKR
jgi:hypothetical protein